MRIHPASPRIDAVPLLHSLSCNRPAKSSRPGSVATIRVAIPRGPPEAAGK